MLNTLKRFFAAHKFLTALAVLAIAGGGILAYKKTNAAKADIRYVLAAAEKTTLVQSVSGSGQISASSQVDVKPQVSGKIISVAVAKGQKVKAGQVLARLDATDALKALRDAEAGLKNAQLSMDKITAPAGTSDLLQAEDAVRTAHDAETKAKEDLDTAYEDSFNSVSDAFLDLPDIMTDLDAILYGSDVAAVQWNVDAYADAAKRYDPLSADTYRDGATNAYGAARAAYDAVAENYKALNRTSSRSALEQLVNQTYEAVKKIADAAKAETDLIQYYKDQLTEHQIPPSPRAETHLALLAGHIGTVNNHAGALLAARRSIQNDKEAIINAAHAITLKQAALDDLKAGADELDVASQELSLQQRRDAVNDARIKLGDDSLRAPFDGVVAKTGATKGDSVSTGSAVATIITETQVAAITLNEVDVAKVRVGQKATLTFDSLSDFSLTGTVADVDALGTATQGVVTYGVTIALDAQDERIKPGMSVSAAIVTEAKTDALVVPSAAVKTQNGVSYVETLDGAEASQAGNPAGTASKTLPRRIELETGLVSDTQTEILSGLHEGDLVIVRAITASAQQAPAANQNRNILQAAGGAGRGGGFGGGAGTVRFQAR